MSAFSLIGRTVCVTGGASGIGRAGALAFARQGAKIAIADVQKARIDQVLDEVRALGVEASGFELDIRDADTTRRAADHFEDTLGPVDGLFACAGISRNAPAEAFQEDDFALVIDVNLKGTFLSCREFGKRMISRRHGSIVIVGSLDGLGGHAGRISYVSSKHALGGLTKTLAIEWGRHGVRVNCIAPGFVDTPLLRGGMPDAFIKDMNDRTPLGRMAHPEEIANVALMLMAEEASYVTGAIIPVDGGMTAGNFTRRNGGDYSSKKLLDAGVYAED